MLKLDQIQLQSVQTTEEKLLRVTKALQDKCDDLQAQINRMNQEQRNRELKIEEHAKESLVGEEDFFEGGPHEKMFFKFEQNINNGCKYSQNIESERWTEPRMVTMKQVRNMVFSMLNQSKFNTDLSEVMKKADAIHDYTVKLNEQDRQLDHKLAEEVLTINNASRKYQQEQAALYTQTTKRLAAHANEIKTIQEGSKR